MRNGVFCRIKSLAAQFFSVSTWRDRTYALRMSARIFQYNYRVTYADCTVGNHIYYARYMDLLEAARGEFFRDLGATFLQWQARDAIFPVVEARLRYQSPARYDDMLTVGVWLTTAERIRLNFAYRISNQSDTVVLEAETFHVCTALNEKPKRLPDDLATMLQPYLHAAKPHAPRRVLLDKAGGG